jgi:hypothetical protein
VNTEQLRNSYSSPNTIGPIKPRRMKWIAYVPRMEKMNAHSFLVGKPEGKKPLGIPTSRREDNIKAS